MRPLAEERAQATVEMAVVAPVMVVLALIVYNLMLFAAASARFDRVAPDIVLIHAAAPAGTREDGTRPDTCSVVQAQLEAAMKGYDVEIDVAREGGSTVGGMLSFVGEPETYRCTMTYRPWPSDFSIAGVRLGAPTLLTHRRDCVIDPWRSGVVL